MAQSRVLPTPYQPIFDPQGLLGREIIRSGGHVSLAMPFEQSNDVVRLLRRIAGLPAPEDFRQAFLPNRTPAIVTWGIPAEQLGPAELQHLDTIREQVEAARKIIPRAESHVLSYALKMPTEDSTAGRILPRVSSTVPSEIGPSVAGRENVYNAIAAQSNDELMNTLKALRNIGEGTVPAAELGGVGSDLSMRGAELWSNPILRPEGTYHPSLLHQIELVMPRQYEGEMVPISNRYQQLMFGRPVTDLRTGKSIWPGSSFTTFHELSHAAAWEGVNSPNKAARDAVQRYIHEAKAAGWKPIVTVAQRAIDLNVIKSHAARELLRQLISDARISNPGARDALMDDLAVRLLRQSGETADPHAYIDDTLRALKVNPELGLYHTHSMSENMAEQGAHWLAGRAGMIRPSSNPVALAYDDAMRAAIATGEAGMLKNPKAAAALAAIVGAPLAINWIADKVRH